MRTAVAMLLALVCAIILGGQTASAQPDYLAPGQLRMELGGKVAPGLNGNELPKTLGLGTFRGLTDDIPISGLSLLAENPIVDAGTKTRSARDVQLYRTIAPSAVEVVTKEGLGSGSLVDTSRDILTCWHVVKGYEFVGVIFKPATEGLKPTRDNIKLGRVIKYDEVADLALIKASEIPPGRIPIRLGDSSEIAVGADVHAIGHPKGDAWTYTTGIISRYRQGFAWRGDDGIQHKADIIQTQTPINPGNSGGPLLSDSGNLIGVNAFKDTSAEGLNFAISIDSVRSFLARPNSRKTSQQLSQAKAACSGKKLATFRNQQNDATVTSFDLFCTGSDNAEYVVPDNTTKAIFLRADRNGDGKADVIFFDLQRRGKWDISFWDNNFSGQWTLVGYHDDGSLTPTRFESYADFQKRMANR